MRLFVLAVAAIAVSIAPAAPSQDDNMKMAAKLLEEAATAFQGGKAKEAIDLATKAVQLDPKNPAAPFVIGSAHLSLRQNDEAVKAFTALIALDPSYALAYDRRGDAYLKSGKFTEAIADFDKFLEAAPEVRTRPLAARHRALLRRQVRRRPQAVRPAPHREPGGRGELGLALPVQRPGEHAEEGPRGPDSGLEGHAGADEAGARAVRREDQARRTSSTPRRTPS